MFIRNTVINAGLVRISEADDRIEFITEGEASVHYVLAHTGHIRWLEKGDMFTVMDAGGSTIDSTLYQCKSTEPLVLEEVCGGECVQAGGVFVDLMPEEKLKESLFNDEESLREMVNAFEKKTKRLFDGTQELNVIQFGSVRDNDRNHGILKGKFNLTVEEVSGTFDETVARTVDSCMKLLRGRSIQHHLLVGGFGDSPFLRKRLSEAFSSHGTDIVTVDEPSKKAAADGSVIWYIKQLVTARAIRFTIGTEGGVPYDPLNEQHHSRSDLMYQNMAGQSRIWIFEHWTKKDTPLYRDWACHFMYRRLWEILPSSSEKYSLPVYVCDHDLGHSWMRDESGDLLPGIRILCTIEAGFDVLMSAMRTARGPNGRYWYMAFEIVISFRGTKIQGRMRWKDEGMMNGRRDQ